MGKKLLIYNPTANHRRAGEMLSDVQQMVANLGEADWVGTEQLGGGVGLAAKAAEQGYDMVVAVGGDGTVHEVVNGLMQTPADRRPVFGVLPMGSGNDFAMAAGVRADLKQAVERLFSGSTREIDAASIRDSDSGRLEYWCNTCGIGLDAKIGFVARRITRIHGFLMYLSATLYTVFREYESVNMKIWIDDQPPFEQDVLMLTIGNGPREGGGFHTTPDSKVDDGVLEFARFRYANRLVILTLIPKIMEGKHTTSPYVTMGAFRRMRIEADRALPIHMDGETFAGYESDVRQVEIEILPGALQVMI